MTSETKNERVGMKHIQISLKRVIDHISKCQTRNSLELLSQIMDAIATNCEILGLTPDDDASISLYDRIHFWHGLNDTWLFAIQCAPNYTVIEQRIQVDDWHALRDSIVAWADVLEWYGLVDYEMGFAEEDIIEAIHSQVSQLRLMVQMATASSSPMIPSSWPSDDNAS